VTAHYQNTVLIILLQKRRPMTLKEITNDCRLTYHQVASCLAALKAKGYVNRIQTGLYEATEDAKLIELPPETQVRVLKQKVEELENQVKTLLMYTHSY